MMALLSYAEKRFAEHFYLPPLRIFARFLSGSISKKKTKRTLFSYILADLIVSKSVKLER